MRLSEIQIKPCLEWFIARDTALLATARRYIITPYTMLSLWNDNFLPFSIFLSPLSEKWLVNRMVIPYLPHAVITGQAP